MLHVHCGYIALQCKPAYCNNLCAKLGVSLGEVGDLQYASFSSKMIVYYLAHVDAYLKLLHYSFHSDFNLASCITTGSFIVSV